MKRKRLLHLIIIFIALPLFAGCKDDSEQTNAYLTLMALPTEVAIPAGMVLDSIVNITNPIPDDPNGATSVTQFGIFGFTNTAGKPVYYVYGEKQFIKGSTVQIDQQGFYRMDYYIQEDGTTYLALADSSAPLSRVERGIGIPKAYGDELPYSFYTPVEEIDGLYSFVDANGITQYRVYATFLEKNGDFFPATPEGEMIPGSLPIKKAAEETLHEQGSLGVSQMLVSPILCTNVPTIYEI